MEPPVLFPEELDNRSLRLLVDRTLSRRKEQQSLSKIERDIYDIITDFPELGFQDRDNLDVYMHFKDAQSNPFLMLSAIWEIKKQIDADTPRGIKKIVHDYFRTTTLKADDIYLVADTYLALYIQHQESEMTLTEKEYLWEMYYSLNQSHAPRTEKAKKETSDETILPGLIGDAFSAIARELHDEASFIKLNPQDSAADSYSDLPIEWITAMSNYWQRPEKKLKRDNIGEIVAYFASPEFKRELPQKLSREDKECLAYIIERNNRVSYSEASKRFGPEHNDGYWWTQDIPKSTLGNLRMMGLVIVGEVHAENDTQRMVMIPNDIAGVLKKIL